MNRKEILDLLANRSWFAATSDVVKAKLYALPEDANGALSHIASQPDEGGGVKVIALKDILFPEGRLFGMIANFAVRNSDGAEFAYQYFIWKQGPASGSKGIVLVEDEHEDITHVVCLRGFKFAPGSEEFDCVGGFSEAGELRVNLSDRFKTKLQEELGLSAVTIKRMIPLGTLLLDGGMTPNRPSLFAAIVDGSTMTLDPEHENPDPYEMRSGAVLVPLDDLWGPKGFLMRNDDAFFHACITRLIALGEINAPNDENGPVSIRTSERDSDWD